MSSVTPSDGYNSYYMKHLTELEDELKSDHARSEQRSRERVEDISNKYRDSLSKIDEKTTDAVTKIREDNHDSLERSKATDRAEMERARRQGYDRFGRDRGSEADTYKTQLTESVETARAQRETDQARMADLDKSFNARVDSLGKDYEGRIDRAAQVSHDSAEETFKKIAENNKLAAEEQRSDVEKRMSNLNRERMEDSQFQRRRTEGLITDNQRDIDNLKTHEDTAAELRINKGTRANLNRIEKTSKLEHDQHALETEDLRDTIKDLLTAENGYSKEYGKGKKDAVHDYEDIWRTRENLIQDRNELETNKLKEQHAVSESNYAHSNERNLHERDAYFSGLLAKQQGENRADQKEVADTYERNRAEVERNVKADKARSQNLLETTLHETSEQRSKALVDQAQSYQTTIKTQRGADQDTIKVLEAELRKKTTNEDVNEVSPALENAVRRSMVKEYEKNLAAESEKNKRLTDTLQTSYSNRIQNADSEHQNVLTHHVQQNQIERHQDQTRFLEHVQDTEFQKDQALRTKDSEMDRQTETMNRAFSQMTTRQQNQSENMLQTVKDDAASRISAIRQESEFQTKSAQRAFSGKQNELIRDYEKRLADQKTDFDDRTEEIRSQTQQSVHDIDRKSKVALDDQARSYEQRITQLDAQSKERERYISQNYEDQLEKVKRSNALLQSKKS